MVKRLSPDAGAANPLQALTPIAAPCRLAAAFCLIATAAKRLNFVFAASAISLAWRCSSALLVSETETRPATDGATNNGDTHSGAVTGAGASRSATSFWLRRRCRGLARRAGRDLGLSSSSAARLWSNPSPVSLRRPPLSSTASGEAGSRSFPTSRRT
jgi:hypothetical protein